MEKEPSETSIKIDLKDFLVKGKVGDRITEGFTQELEQKLDEENSLISTEGTVTFTLLEEEVSAEFDIEYIAETVCARCLEAFKRKGRLAFEREYVLGKRVPENDDELLVDKQFSVEVGEPTLEEIAFDIPMKPICNKACKGFIPNNQ